MERTYCYCFSSLDSMFGKILILWKISTNGPEMTRKWAKMTQKRYFCNFFTNCVFIFLWRWSKWKEHVAIFFGKILILGGALARHAQGMPKVFQNSNFLIFHELVELIFQFLACKSSSLKVVN